MKPATADYRADIDGLRALAILPVIIFHAQASLLPGGYLGVDIFFVISGYLIAGLILRALAEGRFSFKDFYVRRMKRLLPAFFLMTVVALFAGYHLLMPREYAPVLRTALFGAFSASNISLAREGDYFAPNAELNPLLHTWSLAIEEQFYLVFPLFAWALWRRSRSMVVLALVCLSALSLWHSVQLSASNSPWAHFSPFARAWQLSVGCLLAIAHTRPQVTMAQGPVVHVLAFASLAAIATAMLIGTSDDVPLQAAVSVVAATLLLIHTGRGRQTIAARILASRLPVTIGLVSYSTYLWHQPVIAFSKLFPGSTGTIYVAIVLVISLVLGFASWRFVETPLRHWKGNARRTGIAALLCIIGFSAFSVAGLRTGAFSDRFERDLAAIDVTNPDDITSKSCGHYGKHVPDRSELCTFAATLPVDASIGTVAIWGDSHAESLSSGMISASRPFPYVHLAFNGCFVAPDVGRPRKPNGCIGKGEIAEREVMDHDEIRTVVIHARWEFSLEDHDADEGIRRRKGTIAFLERLVAAGKNIILVRSVPVHAFDVPSTAVRSLRLGLDPEQTVSLEDYEKAQKKNNDTLDQWAKDYGAVVVDVADLYCDAETAQCSSMDDEGKVKYSDESHLTPRGARPLADRVIETILALRE